MAIAVPDGERVAICVSTIADSRVSPLHARVGVRFFLVTHAMGRAYLAYCPEEEREILIRLLAASEDPEDNPPSLEKVVQGIVATVRRQG